jgi:ferritin-like protein
MASQFHGNELFLRSLSKEQVESLRKEAENLSKNHVSALTEQLQRLNIK